MSSRDAIMQRIRQGLSARAGQPPALPPVPEVWPRGTSDPETLAQRFAAELSAVHGETIRCRTMDEARQHLAELVHTAGWTTLGALDRPLAREVAADLPAAGLTWIPPDAPSGRIAELPAGLITAECLLADTGTCAVSCPTAAERLMCYLPPACVIVARIEQLAEHLTAAWPGLSQRCLDAQGRGELVLITGPSRTSDIEKVLILGVHGPMRLVVLLVG
jgi:L-lactate dehydrogenase complex protein LldG